MYKLLNQTSNSENDLFYLISSKHRQYDPKRGKVKADTCTTHANIATHKSTLQRSYFASRKITLSLQINKVYSFSVFARKLVLSMFEYSVQM